MSANTDQFERDIAKSIKGVRIIPFDIPQWMRDIGIRPGAKIIGIEWVGSSGAKTDILIRLENSEPIKISAKLSSADYFGNWYSHGRVIEEFGADAFYRLVSDCTKWSNRWKTNPSASLFVGVSICFGRRSGNTAREFTDVFTYNDIVKIVAGYGSGDHIANCLYVSSSVPRSINDLVLKLKPIDKETIFQLSSNFKIAYRPINPMTEGTNRGKAIYTQFKPYQRLSQKTTIKTLSQLIQLGEYVEVEPNSLNHNRLLNELESNYNIFIPRK
ncbi:hypothetical protein ACT3XG_25000 [Paenibacillus polymyxa]|uniref:hypothetical protein n=1 Tax=Paenibacillus TaxID=44249 RepID=UPI00142E222B|nr:MULTISPECIES: hypothetical protein [Paenibacillus]KAF6657266.1 hypothetical protein HFD99_11000 [Paenibacillus sp. EKM301P]UBS87293.1 hypothetical protein LAZ93_24915 [Paenibacillus polymyxa]WHX35875.1 hypothetical protein QNH38_25675 [Paenibacillus polymyxa]